MLALMGEGVTGIDSRALMITKAKERAQRDGVNVDFICGNALQMPFKNRQFDVVIAESVTVFVPIRRVIKEYFRVLKPGGRIVNLELCKYRLVPRKESEEVYRNEEMAMKMKQVSHFLHQYATSLGYTIISGKK